MKNVRAFLLVVAALALAASCSTLAEGAMSGALGALGSGVAGGVSAKAASAVVDFQSGEVLCSTDDGSMFESAFYVAKVLTPASPATKNQAEVVWISDGKKAWVNHVVNSRKATKADYAVGATVFVLAGWSGYDDISADSYRKDRWLLATVTSVDELYKNRVEVGGNPYHVNFIRVPTDPVK